MEVDENLYEILSGNLKIMFHGHGLMDFAPNLSQIDGPNIKLVRSWTQ